MFRTFRRLIEVLETLSLALARAVDVMAEVGPSDARLDALERDRASWEANVEGMLLKAEGKLKAANNSEARERTMRKAYEANLDPFDPNSDEAEEQAVQPGNAEASQEEGMYDVPVDLEAPNGKSLALRAKFM